MTTLSAHRGDITREHVDVIVNAANSSLLGGGGVDGAVHRAGGPEILAECRRLRETTLPDGLPAGAAVATTAGRLPAGHVVHTVGPVFSTREDRSAVLSSAYEESMRVASSLSARSIAFPAISAGVYGWPMDDAARLAVAAVRHAAAEDGSTLEEVRFVLFSDDALAVFIAALG